MPGDRLFSCRLLGFALGLCFLVGAGSGGGQERSQTGKDSEWAGITVVDAETGRGIPLAELETVNSLCFVTDNAGRVAIREPDLLDREVYFAVRSHGYELAKDGFGFAGARVTLTAGRTSEIRLQRTNLAERLCRLTGEGRYRDSLLLGHPLPRPESPRPGRVAGQDSVQAAVYRGKISWFWGDTQRLEYPLGLFRVAGATTSLADALDAKTDLSHGFAYDYFVDEKTRFARAMLPLPERPEGVIWIDGLTTVTDAKGAQRLVAHYSRRKTLEQELEHGLAMFDDERELFEAVRPLPRDETWRHPSGQAVAYAEAETKWLLFGNPAPCVRVRATLDSLLDPNQYEAFTCAKRGPLGQPLEPDVDSDGQPRWRWQQDLPPADAKQEQAWVARGLIPPEQARFYPADAASPKQRVTLHNGTVRWNAFRQRWVMLAGQLNGSSSFLGEVWYAEAKSPTGPFPRAVRVVTHHRQTFYNVCQHDFLDRDAGRFIHFEGTYTQEFSGNPEKTPRYNYNQVLYRLDLSHGALRAAHSD